MRAPLATLLTACLTTSGLSVCASPRVAFASAGPAAKTPEGLYEEGRKAYRLGKFKVAVDKWEEAYAMSDNPLLLYNISLAYKGLYTINDDLADLKKARAVLDNFITLAEADPDLDPDDAPERLAELDEMIEEAEAREAANEPPPPKPDPGDVQDDSLRAVPSGKDPGKKLRIAGAATMGGGGALVILGAALGAWYGVKGIEYRDELQRLNNPMPDPCAGMPPPPAGQPDMRSVECRQLLADRDAARNNGRAANLGLGLSLGVAGGIGLAALVTGAVLFVQGNRRTRTWEKGTARDLRLEPTRRGLVLRGRF